MFDYCDFQDLFDIQNLLKNRSKSKLVCKNLHLPAPSCVPRFEYVPWLPVKRGIIRLANQDERNSKDLSTASADIKLRG